MQDLCRIDWGSEKHRVCLMDSQGNVIRERWVEHSGSSLAELVDWLRPHTPAQPDCLAAAIEIPRGAIVETLLEHGFQVFSINPKQLDRFRDRYSPAGAKDDRRDAFVLADALRTHMHCFRAAPGAQQAAAEHALMLIPRLRLLHQQRTDLARRIQTILDELAAPTEHTCEHRDAAILLSLPGLGRKTAATMLSEAAQAIAQ
jgi:transposase